MLPDRLVPLWPVVDVHFMKEGSDIMRGGVLQVFPSLIWLKEEATGEEFVIPLSSILYVRKVNAEEKGT